MRLNWKGIKRKARHTYKKAKKSYAKSKPLRMKAAKRARTISSNIDYYFSN